MKKVMIGVLAAVLTLLTLLLTACGGTNPTTEPGESSKTVTPGNQKTTEAVPTALPTEQTDDETGDPTDLQPKKPVITVDEAGIAAWLDMRYVGVVYEVDKNGEISRNELLASTQLAPGDTLRVRMIEYDGKPFVSDWSETVSFASDYEWTKLEMSLYDKQKLLAYEKAAPGAYDGASTVKCVNGDVISYRGNSWIDVFSRTGGAYVYIVPTFNYMGAPHLTDYTYTDYNGNKLAYYTGLAGVVGELASSEFDAGQTYADYTEFLTLKNINLLPYNEIDTNDQTKYELVGYTCYSGRIEDKYFNTTFLHKTMRGAPAYMEKYADKIEYWTLERGNFGKVGVYSDYKLTIAFKKSVTVGELGVLAGELSKLGVEQRDVDGYLFFGEYPVYDYPLEDGDDKMYDTYVIRERKENTNGTVEPASLEITYMEDEWFDGLYEYGVLYTGLWKYVNDNKYLIIAPDGKVNSDFILPPAKNMGNFRLSFAGYGDSSDDPDDGKPDPNAGYTVERVGDTLVTCSWNRWEEDGREFCEYEYEVCFTKDGKSMKRHGHRGAEDKNVIWDDAEEFDSYPIKTFYFYELIAAGFRSQFAMTDTGKTTTVLGKVCKIYTLKEEDSENYTTYYVDGDGVTLRRVYREVYDGGWNDQYETLTAYEKISSFSSDVAKIVSAAAE